MKYFKAGIIKRMGGGGEEMAPLLVWFMVKHVLKSSIHGVVCAAWISSSKGRIFHLSNFIW